MRTSNGRKYHNHIHITASANDTIENESIFWTYLPLSLCLLLYYHHALHPNSAAIVGYHDTPHTARHSNILMLCTCRNTRISCRLQYHFSTTMDQNRTYVSERVVVYKRWRRTNCNHTPHKLCVETRVCRRTIIFGDERISIVGVYNTKHNKPIQLRTYALNCIYIHRCTLFDLDRIYWMAFTTKIYVYATMISIERTYPL